jgi:hypothetical protein
MKLIIRLQFPIVSFNILSLRTISLNMTPIFIPMLLVMHRSAFSK